VLLATATTFACAGNNSTDSGNVGGASSGGQINSPTGGNVGTRATGGDTGVGGAPLAMGGRGSGGSNDATGGKVADNTSAATGGSANPATGGVSTGGTSVGKASGGTSAATGGNANPATGGASTGGTSIGNASGGTPSTGGSKSTSAGSTSTTGGAAPGVGGGSATKSVGCGKTSTLTFGTVPGESGTKVGTGKGGYVTIQSGGQSRGFAMRLPDNYDNTKPYWLIFGFHWNGGNSAEVDSGGGNGYWWSYYGLQRKSGNNAIFVAPDGIGAGWANSGGRDLTFTDDMVKLIEENYCVDTSNIITTGFSYGGGMSYEIACARAKVFRAAVIYEGAQLSGCDGGNDPIALWQTVGLTDTTCGMNLATPIRDRFVKNNGCTAQDPPQPPKPGSYLNPGGHICTDYAGCSSGHPVRWCVSQSGHGPGPIDGTADLYNSCATAPKTCSASCPCTWTPDDVWPWLTGQTITGQTPNATK
ncbi:MAG TPA: hypothetical protein VIV60_37450, partial [Polyangiaceae bacterium]